MQWHPTDYLNRTEQVNQSLASGEMTTIFKTSTFIGKYGSQILANAGTDETGSRSRIDNLADMWLRSGVIRWSVVRRIYLSLQAGGLQWRAGEEAHRST